MNNSRLPSNEKPLQFFVKGERRKKKRIFQKDLIENHRFILFAPSG